MVPLQYPSDLAAKSRRLLASGYNYTYKFCKKRDSPRERDYYGSVVGTPSIGGTYIIFSERDIKLVMPQR